MPLEEILGGLSISSTGRAMYGRADAEIMTNGTPAYKDADWLREHYTTKNLSQEEIADIAGVSYHTIRAWIRKHKLQKPLGSWSAGKAPANKGKHYVNPERNEADRAQISERMKGEKIEDMSGRPRKLATRPFVPKAAKIISVVYAGAQMTYDIEMDGANHNFVANGIVTHNSQQSQRYVSGRMLRFVERPEYRADAELHGLFLERIDAASAAYARLAERLMEIQQGGAQILGAESHTDLRKKVQQTARSVLPNETEAPIVVTANARAWRHILSMRASSHAETEIRELAVRVFLCLALTEPVLFGDYSLEELPDGTLAVKTEYEKI
jgi:DNA-binding XRE family transcriptional regulator